MTDAVNLFWYKTLLHLSQHITTYVIAKKEVALSYSGPVLKKSIDMLHL